jgi:hypothetical protein
LAVGSCEREGVFSCQLSAVSSKSALPWVAVCLALTFIAEQRCKTHKIQRARAPKR